ncbi:tRNA lysidine(34) synthetase TilS [Mycoplasmopsis phocirhinis]|uniref:tRNA(Ile)-lysidine synthase n=1 Tax=Mycoplasmopsis phocirhinis TaxID=142650 RepID=A0A4P6MMU8_9BACT|nr:tRNA lysidine(34) synthetase TilS [Mycoplasmopsis phocirhinis]QBF34975.1 tRNA lysidine(34) synthetase TilS [Mycoplasmopsis phocirhinis]
MKINKKLIAVSGGPDSMFLLNWCINTYGSQNLIVASVNYKTRTESDSEIELVKKYCSENNVILEVFECFFALNKGNFENWAREQRYEFFKQIYFKYNCDLLILGHHKDDFIETAQMQLESKRFPVFFGIKSTNLLKNMNIYRPFVNKYFKDEILSKVREQNIPFCVDQSNFDIKFKRNQFRKNNSFWTKEQKQDFYLKIIKINDDLNLQNKKIDIEYINWTNTDFSQDFFAKTVHQDRLMYKYIHNFFENIKLSSKKIVSILQWYLSNNRTSTYLLKKDIKIRKKSGKLLNKFFNLK